MILITSLVCEKSPGRQKKKKAPCKSWHPTLPLSQSQGMDLIAKFKDSAMNDSKNKTRFLSNGTDFVKFFIIKHYLYVF
jgi:hypothetical protein